jgi:uncharacterized membrane protein YhiD involved in acid resistance
MPNTKPLMEQLWDPSTVSSLPQFTVNLVIAAVLAWLLGEVYVRFGQSLSNRRLFARNFLPLTLTTALVITIVKSSLALSLGLVGALSIVRFRAAIKEPEELAYLFLAISIGLGLGAGQPLLTGAAILIITGVLAVRSMLRKNGVGANLFLTVTTAEGQRLGLSQIEDTLKACGATASVRRFDESPEQTEAAFQVAFADNRRVEEFTGRLRTMNPNSRVSFVEDRGLIG